MARRLSEAAERALDRREREDRAPRLLATVPRLQALDLVLSESRSQSKSVDTRYVRRVVVASAPALFDITCGDASCRDGGHEVTYHVLRQLQQGSTRFDGQDTCSGSVGPATCGRVLHYAASATFTPND
jgi:hypothetical protein